VQEDRTLRLFSSLGGGGDEVRTRALLRESRQEVGSWGEADLERCLALSLNECDYVQDDGSALKAADLLETQGALLDVVARQSELEYIEQLVVQQSFAPEVQEEGEPAIDVLALSDEQALEIALKLSRGGGQVHAETASSEHDDLQRALAASVQSSSIPAYRSSSAAVDDEEDDLQRAIAASLQR
jgi:hypothetical protein